LKAQRIRGSALWEPVAEDDGTASAPSGVANEKNG
jgi:hypothetical protein